MIRTSLLGYESVLRRGGDVRVMNLKLLNFIFMGLLALLSSFSFAQKPPSILGGRCARWLLPEARYKRSLYVDKIIQYHLEDIHSRVWERFLPRVRRWITDSEEESDAVRAFASSYFDDFSELVMLVNDRTLPEFVSGQLMAASNRSPGMVVWIAVTPGSTLLAPKFKPMLNLIDSLAAAGKLVLIVYETGPTAFDFAH